MINDEKAIYDMSMHKYILKREYLENKLNINLNEALQHDMSVADDKDADIFLERLSNSLYDYIYAFSKDPDAMEYYLSLTDTPAGIKNREYIISALVEHAFTILTNNSEIAVFFKNGDLKDSVAPSTKQRLQANGLLFRGKLFNLPYNYFEKYGKEY